MARSDPLRRILLRPRSYDTIFARLWSQGEGAAYGPHANRSAGKRKRNGRYVSEPAIKLMVELRGIEPLTSWLTAMRSPS